MHISLKFSGTTARHMEYVQQYLFNAAHKTLIDAFKHIKFVTIISKRFWIWYKTCTKEWLSHINYLGKK